MNELRELLERQARWQRSRRDLAWPEKIRMVEAIRASIVALRQKPRPVVDDQHERPAHRD